MQAGIGGGGKKVENLRTQPQGLQQPSGLTFRTSDIRTRGTSTLMCTDVCTKRTMMCCVPPVGNVLTALVAAAPPDD